MKVWTKLQNCRTRLTVFLALLALAVVGAKPVHEIVGKVVGVTDGDTITVLDATKTQYKIRLEGIDAPESHQAFGTKAKQALSSKVFDKPVTVKWSEKDRYGRTLGDVYVGDKLINQELVEEGWAWHYKKYSDSTGLAEAEVCARKAKLGLWDDKNPIPPWDFRKPPTVATPQPKSKTAQPTTKEQEQPAAAPKQVAPKEITVYVTKTGAKYHRANCRYLAKSMYEISLDDAKKKYTACSVCNPPE